jgi:ferritin-like metal-binding protein YciE
MAAKTSRKRSSKESPDCTELLVTELQEIHGAESQLARAVPRLVKNVEAENLKQALEQRLEEGERVLQDVESALEELDESPGRRKNVAAEGLINDVRERTQEIEPGPALDEVLIAGIQKTEHYCIAAWGTARSLARAVEQKTTVRAMERALKEGKSFDAELTDLAESEITPALLSRDSEEEDSSGEERPVRSGRSRGSERHATN